MPSSFTAHLESFIIRWQQLCGRVQSVPTRSPLPAHAERQTGLINFPRGLSRAGEKTFHSCSGGDSVPPRFMRPLNPKTSGSAPRPSTGGGSLNKKKRTEGGLTAQWMTQRAGGENRKTKDGGGEGEGRRLDFCNPANTYRRWWGRVGGGGDKTGH